MPNIKVEPTIPNYPPQGIQAQLDLVYLWNPDVANDLIDQINTALEEVGKDLDNYLTKAEAAATYATQTEVTQLSGALEEVSNKVDTVDNDLKGLGDQTASIQQDVNTLKTEVPSKVSKTGDTMTGALTLSGETPTLNFIPTDTFHDRSVTVYFDDGLNLLNFRYSPSTRWVLSSDSLYRAATIGKAHIGEYNFPLENVYTSHINAGDDSEDITVPTVGGTITLNEVNFKTAITDTNKGLTEADAYTKEEVDAKVSSVYRFRGSVATYNDLPTEGNVQGDVWNVEDTGANYAWDGTKWDKLSETIDLTPYLTKEDAASTYATITTVNGKQDALTPDQMAAVNSGITAAKVASYDAYAGEISAAKTTADKADGAAEVAQQTANLAGQEAAKALSGLAGKVNIAQGADNAGKVMMVGEDGNLAPADAPSSSLPDQTGNAGKCLVTDGEQVSWEERLQNRGGNRNLVIGKLSTGPGAVQSDAIIIAPDKIAATAEWSDTITIGPGANNSGYDGSICIGSSSAITKGTSATARGACISLGTYARVESNKSIQIGKGTNAVDNSFQVKDYQLLDLSTGLIPTERLATGGTTGQILTKTDDGATWSAAPSSAVTTDATLTGTGTADSPLGVSQSVKDSIDGKLPLAGGTMSGDINIGNNSLKMAGDVDILGNKNIGGIWVRQGGPGGSVIILNAQDHKIGNVAKLSNGADIAIPTTGGTMALLSDIPDISNLATKTEVQQEIQDAIGTIETALAEV